MKLSIIISSTAAISPRKAALAYEYVVENISNGPIVISFEDIEDFTSAFANAFIGKLYMDIDPSKLNQALSFSNLDSNNVWAYKIENAIRIGSDDNFRNHHQANLSELIAS
jgi:hypothetical protein